jgi:hypothetical protein
MPGFQKMFPDDATLIWSIAHAIDVFRAAQECRSLLRSSSAALAAQVKAQEHQVCDDPNTKHEDGWNTLWQIASVLAMAALTDGVGLAVDWLGEAAESVAAIKTAAQIVNREETVHKVLDFAGEQVIDKVKDKANETANETGSRDSLSARRVQRGR